MKSVSHLKVTFVTNVETLQCLNVEVSDAFYVHSSAWQEAVMKRGVTVLQQLLENLHRVPRISPNPSPGIV